MRKLFWLVLVMSSLFCGSTVHAAGDITIRWFGHSCFLIESSQGTKILTDPVGEETGYDLPDVMPDIVTISHEHFDHNYVRPYTNSPVILRGEDFHGRGWQTIKEEIKDVKIHNIGTYHDDVQGKKSGKNSVFIIEVDGLRLVHLGDLGHLLTGEQIEAIGTPDVLFIPTGGAYTIDYLEADDVIKQLKPGIAIPMHFKTPACKFTLFGVKRFLKGKDNARVPGKNSIVVNKESLPDETEIVVLDYK
ncbi:MAG: MBL fold metallo-hydrolase [Candidatus Brocadiales bacterium]